MKAFVHPETYKGIAATCKIGDTELSVESCTIDFRHNQFGIDFYIDENIPQFMKKWEFPKDRFVEYEKKDEEWAIPIKYGRWVDDYTQQCILMIEDKMLSFTKPIMFNYQWDGGFQDNIKIKGHIDYQWKNTIY